MKNKFAERLKELRLEKNLSQYQLARELNCEITHSAISLWELKQRSPNLEALIILATYFNVSLDYLVGMIDDE